MSITRFLLATPLLVLLAGPADAAFYFNKSIVTIEVDPNDVVGSTFTRSITVQFMSVCEPGGGCKPKYGGQDFKFGLSSQYIEPDTNDTNIVDPPPREDLPQLVTDLWLWWGIEEATYQERNIKIPNRIENTYSRPIKTKPGEVAKWRTATINFKFALEALYEVNPGVCKSFFLIGADVESPKSWDTLEICFRKIDNRKIKISNLSTVPLTEFNASDESARVLPFCVFTTDGDEYWLGAWGKHVDYHNRFTLSNGKDTIPYEIEFSPEITGKDNWKRLGPGDALIGKGNGNQDQKCGGQNNARFRVYLDEKDVGGVDSGVYSDTVTVTVTIK